MAEERTSQAFGRYLDGPLALRDTGDLAPGARALRSAPAIQISVGRKGLIKLTEAGARWDQQQAFRKAAETLAGKL